MQTFLPETLFSRCAQVLDQDRLGKQRVEAWQILNINVRRATTPKHIKIAWENHPAVLMWRGYELALIKYGLAMCHDWKHNLKFKDSLTEKFLDMHLRLCAAYPEISEQLPPWIDDDKVQATHRGMLFHKDPKYYQMYSKYSWVDEYFWPVTKTDSCYPIGELK